MTSGALGLLGNEPWRVAAKEDSMRSFVRRPGVRGAVLHVAVHVTVGVNVATMDADIDGSSYGWAPSDRFVLPDIRDAAGRQNVTITLSSRGAAATWLTDDVMVDPWRTLQPAPP